MKRGEVCFDFVKKLNAEDVLFNLVDQLNRHLLHVIHLCQQLPGHRAPETAGRSLFPRNRDIPLDLRFISIVGVFVFVHAQVDDCVQGRQGPAFGSCVQFVFELR